MRIFMPKRLDFRLLCLQQVEREDTLFYGPQMFGENKGVGFYRGLIHPSIRGVDWAAFQRSIGLNLLVTLFCESWWLNLCSHFLYIVCFRTESMLEKEWHQKISSSARFVIESNLIFWKMTPIYSQHPSYWLETLSDDRYSFVYHKSKPERSFEFD